MNALSTKNQELSALQKSFYVVQKLKSELKELEAAKTEPIAIVGMSCRFPGGADNPESYWQLLRSGRDAITEVPRDRWSLEDYYDPDPEIPGKTYTKYGGFLASGVDGFDPEFFGISPREAKSLDPQQRLLLEVSWEALEAAGVIPQQLAESKTGIFVGIGQNDYAQLQMKRNNPQEINAYSGTGSAFCFASGRLSYVLGLQGPSLAIDTACSSSLVSVHLACQSLRNRECARALAGGVQLILSPEVAIFLSKTKALSPDGRCKTFDAAANGFGRGEGCGMLLLKRLSDAVADGDNILALIRGSAVNHDGASSGLTVPNGLAQQKLLKEALKNAKVSPSQVSYLEAHGTGTSLGDPIELEALAAVFSQGHSSANPLTVASVKTNIGHLEAAAGVAGLIKTILAMQHREIPPHLHFQQPNPYLNWEDLPLNIPTAATPWLTQEPKIAGVSSFGISGTNAHVILEEAPPQSQETEPDAEAPLERPLHLFNISAKSQAALVDLAHRYRDYLQHSTASIGDLCYSVNNYRQSFNYRLSALASSTAQLQEKLAAFVANSEVSGVFHQEVTSTTPPKVAFLFTGQGSQYPGMGEQLYQTQPSFRAAFKQCAQLFDPELDPTLLSVLYGENTALLNQTLYTQPALFTLEYALAQLWLNWGINPSVVIGHSVGEYVAATIAGVFSLEDAVKLLAARARGIQALPEGGGLVALLASAAVTADLIAPYASQVSIAAYNAPNSTVISGANEALAAIIQQLEQRGLKHKRLSVSHAFHSPLMSPMLADFRRVAESISYHPPEIDFISNLTGELNPSGVTTPQYWVDHVSEAVNFVAGMKTLEQQSCQCFLEIGAQPTLLGLARRCLSSAEGFWLPSLRPTGGEWEQMLASVAQLFVAGVGVDWLAFEEESSRRRVSLPTYPFQRQRFWLDEAQLLDGKGSTNALPQSSLLRGLHTGDVDALVAQLNEYQLADAEKKLLPKLLKLLVQQHQEQLNQSALDDLLYQVKWQQSPSNPATVTGTENWVIFADRQGIGAALAQGLEALGHRCYQILAGTGYQQKDATTWQINPADADEYQKLWEQLSAATKVIYCWNLDVAPVDSAAPILEQSQLGCASALHLIQSVVNQKLTAKVWLVTQGAIAVAGSASAPSQAPVWGLGKVIALEHPDVWGGMIDLDPEATPEAATNALIQEITATSSEDQITYRQDNRYVPRLVRQRFQSKAVVISPENSYLVTGGLGALGERIAHWLVEKGARQLILTTRRDPAQYREKVSALEKLGAKVLVYQADVANPAQTKALFDTIAALPPLAGIVHAAGVLGLRLFMELSAQDVASVLRPKVEGAWILHQLTQELPLDFWVTFSSIASVWGSQGQAHYAAANQFLDTLADYRQHQGLPALSINWGPWTGGGMTDAEAQTLLNKMGVVPLPPQKAIAAWEHLLGTKSAHAVVAEVDWAKFKVIYQARGNKPLLERIKVERTAVPTQKPAPSSQILAKLQTAPEHQRQEVLIAHLQTEVAQILGFDHSRLPDPKQGFFTMGIDSLMTMELQKKLEASFGVVLPPTLTFEAPTIKDLAAYFAREVFDWHSAPAPSKPEAAVNTQVAQLSDKEVQASLDQELAELESLLQGE